MTKTRRVLAALSGESVDRTPISFWYHFHLENQPPSVFADAELAFYRKYDVDWLKVMHDFPFGNSDLIGSVKTPSDFRKLHTVLPLEGGFGLQIEALRRIADGLKGEAMFLDTFFSPWSTAQKLCGRNGVEMMRADRESFKEGLRIISDSFVQYVPMVLETGASGIYFAVDGASDDVMTREEYADVARQFDVKILTAAKAAPFNVLHIHGTRIHFRDLLDYPANAISWSAGVTRPTIAEARSMHGGCLLTGIDEVKTILSPNLDDIRAEVKAAIRDAGGKGIIVASGCAVPTDTPNQNLQAARAAVEE